MTECCVVGMRSRWRWLENWGRKFEWDKETMRKRNRGVKESKVNVEGRYGMGWDVMGME